MVDQTTVPTGRTTDVGADISDAGRRLEDEGKALSETIGEAKDAVAAQARDLKDQAADRLGGPGREHQGGSHRRADRLLRCAQGGEQRALGQAARLRRGHGAAGRRRAREPRARRRGPVADRDARQPALVRAPQPGRLHRRLGARRLRPRPACRRAARPGGREPFPRPHLRRVELPATGGRRGPGRCRPAESGSASWASDQVEGAGL